MVEETRVKDLREKKPKKENIPSLEEGIYLFISYDLVNSTKLKTLCSSHEWQVLIEEYYKITGNLASNPLNSMIWKYIGDEVLMYKHIPDPETLCDTIDNTYTTLGKLNSFIRNWELQSTIHRNLLAVKCTTWCTLVGNDSQEANKCVALQVSTINSRGRYYEQYVPDFIGPDIDIGFRIAEHADRARMLLSSDLALLVFKCSKISDKPQQKAYCSKIAGKMKIVSFKQLKGVWHDRPYPIIWYEEEDPWGNVYNSFEYDEHLSSDIVKELLDAKDNQAQLKDISILEKVYHDVGIPAKLDAMLAILHKKSQPRKQ